MKVVEPFMNEHSLSFEVLVNGVTDPLKFSDLYDYWNLHTSMDGCVPLGRSFAEWTQKNHSCTNVYLHDRNVKHFDNNAKHYKMIDRYY